MYQPCNCCAPQKTLSAALHCKQGAGLVTGCWIKGQPPTRRMRKLAAELVREQMFRFLHQEVPYALEVRTCADAARLRFQR